MATCRCDWGEVSDPCPEDPPHDRRCRCQGTGVVNVRVGIVEHNPHCPEHGRSKEAA